MKRILFSVGINAVEALGSVTRMVAIANEVRKMEPEAEILFRSAGSEAEHVEKHGFKSVGGYKPNIMGFPDPVWKILSGLRGEWDGKVPALKRMDDVIRLKGIFTKKFVETTFREWMEIIESFRPDTIVSEFDLMAPIAARKAGIPHFTTCGTVGTPEFFSELFFKAPHPDKRLCHHYNRLLKRLGMPLIDNILDLFAGYGYSRRLIPSIPELEDLPEDEMTHYTGGIIPENFSKSRWAWDKKRPLVYVYLSISQITAELAETVLASAFADSEFDVIVAGAGNPYFEKRGGEYSVGNVRFYRFLPADEVLKQADIAIHHGGQNTTIQCIESRVPALIFPGLHFERHFNARKAAELGCAYCLKNEEFTKENLTRLCTEMLRVRPFAEALQKYSAIIKRYGGSRKAAELVLKAC